MKSGRFRGTFSDDTGLWLPDYKIEKNTRHKYHKNISFTKYNSGTIAFTNDTSRSIASREMQDKQ